MIFLHFPERFFVCIIIFRSKGSKLAPVWQHIQQRDFSVISQNQPINTSVRLCCSHLESQTAQFFSEATCGIAAKNSPVAQKDVFLPAGHYEKDVWQDILSNKMWIMTFLYSVFLRFYVMCFASPETQKSVGIFASPVPSSQRFFQWVFGEMHEIRTVVKESLRDFHKICE